MKTTPPKAIKKTHIRQKHDQKWDDPYSWLEDQNNPETINYLKAENAYTAACMQDTEEVQKIIYEEIKNRIQLEDVSVASPYKNYLYYDRTRHDDEYSVLCRKLKTGGPEEVLLDENRLSIGHDYFDLGAWDISPDEQHIVFSIDTIGDERYTIYVLDLKTGHWLVDRIVDTGPTVVWDADGKSFFYCRHDNAMRPYRVLQHKIGTLPANDKQVFLEADAHFHVDISRSISDEYIFISCASHSTSEFSFIPANKSDTTPKVILKRESDVEYYPEHQGDYFLLRTNRTRENFALTKVKISDLSQKESLVYEPAAENIYLEDFTVTAKYLGIIEIQKAESTLKILSPNAPEKIITMNEPCYSLSLLEDQEYLENDLRYHYESLTTPSSVFNYQCDTNQTTLLKQDQVLGHFNPNDYQTERLWATAKDGTQVPISIVYKKSTPRNGTAPCYLYGYGAYGISIDPGFSYSRISLLDRGYIYAIAHVRGGADLGEDWYHDGKLENKKNSFTDFIHCAEYLIQNHFAHPQKISAYGGSAGGFLVGASLNMRPDLFHICILEVPFLDVLNTMLNPDLPLTVGEYDEWGDPNERASFDRIRSLSPYDNLKAVDFPHCYISASLQDTHVQYWEAVKWLAKLRDIAPNAAEFLLKMHMEAGHGGVSGRFAVIRDIAFEYAFILKYMDRTKKE